MPVRGLVSSVKQKKREPSSRTDKRSLKKVPREFVKRNRGRPGGQEMKGIVAKISGSQEINGGKKGALRAKEMEMCEEERVGEKSTASGPRCDRM